MVGRIGPGETAEALSKNLGTREVERSNVSTSYDGKAGSTSPTTTLTYSRDSLALYVPAELSARLGDKPSMNGCVFAVAVQGKTYEILWPYFSLPKVRKAHVAAQWTYGLQPPQEPAVKSGESDSDTGGSKGSGKAGKHGGGNIPEPLDGHLPSQLCDTADRPPLTAHGVSMDEVTVDVVAVSGIAVYAGDIQAAHVTNGFDAVEAVSELTVSHDPAQTAAHLALQALEILKPRQGPPQRVHPKITTSVKSRR